MFNKMQVLAVGAVLVLVGLSTWATLENSRSAELSDPVAEQFSTMMH